MRISSLSTDNIVKQLRPKGSITLSDEQIAELQACVLKITLDIVEFCRAHDMHCLLAGGSCLGAVRHHGFIPWDDDVDLLMTRVDAESFCAAFAQAMGDKYLVVTPWDSPDYGASSIRIVAKGTQVRGIANVSEEYNGAAVDIFVVESVPASRMARKLHGVACMALGLILSCVRYRRVQDEIRPMLEGNADAQKAIMRKVRIGDVFSFAALDRWTRWTDRVYSLFRDSRSQYVSIPAGRRHYFGEIHPREALFPGVDARFEGAQMPIPRDADAYLRSLYGPTYMQVPEQGARETHVLYEFDLGSHH